MLSVQSLRVDYDQVVAVQDFSLELRQGEIFGLVGPNGAGKTSVIKAIAGVIEPTYGDISIAGHHLQASRAEALKRLGYMPDFSPLYEHLKVWEYMDVFGAAYLIPRSERREKLQYWLGRLDLVGKYDDYVRNLSRGMRQRLVLAKTLLTDPQVLLLDEPASGLDPIARMDMRKVLEEVAALGKTIVISSHVLSELSDFCTGIGIMEKGRLVVAGTMDQIRQKTNSQTKVWIKLLSSADIQKLMTELNARGLSAQKNEKEERVVTIDFSGDETAAAQILQDLASQKILISEFKVHKEGIEDIFYKVGAKEAS